MPYNTVSDFLASGGKLWTYKHHDNRSAGLNRLALEFRWRRGNAHVALRARQTLSLGDVGMEGGIIALLGNGLHLSPDGGILGAQEECKHLVELKAAWLVHDHGEEF